MIRSVWLALLIGVATIGPVCAGVGGLEVGSSQERLVANLSELQQISRNGVDYVVIDDMLLPQATVRGAEGLPLQRWPGGVVPIAFNANVSVGNQALFFQACQWWAVANIACIARTNEQNFIEVIDGRVNQSFVGMVGGSQPLVLFNWGIAGIIAHEIGHALGLVHEHQRMDRSTFVKVNLGNVQQGTENNFVILSTETRSAYDFASIMHYHPTAFSRNGNPTIQAVDPGNDALMGNRARLSERDIVTAMRMYGENMANPSSRIVQSAINSRLVLAQAVAWDHGYRLRVTSGPTEERWVVLNICESFWYFPRVTWQSVAPAARVRFDAIVEANTVEDGVAYFRPPPKGMQCP